MENGFGIEILLNDLQESDLDNAIEKIIFDSRYVLASVFVLFKRIKRCVHVPVLRFTREETRFTRATNGRR